MLYFQTHVIEWSGQKTDFRCVYFCILFKCSSHSATQTPSASEKHSTPLPSLRKFQNVISQSVSNWEPTSWGALTGHEGKKAPGLSVTRPVISHGVVGPHSEAGIAAPPLCIVLFPPWPDQAPQVAANVPPLHLHSGAQYLQQIRPQACTWRLFGRRHTTRWLFGRCGEWDGSDKDDERHYLH